MQEEAVKQLQIGQYLLIWVTPTALGNPIATQGKLKSIDWNKRTLVLTSTVYKNTEYTVAFDSITSIDDTRTGSGALGPAQEPDWFFGADGKWRKNGVEYKES